MSKPMSHSPQKVYQESKNQIMGLAFLIVVCVVAVYFNSFSGVFVLDDRSAIVDNEQIHRLWPLDPILFGVRPVLNLTLALNYALTGLNVWSYHALNLLIHILAGLTLFGIVRRTFLTESLKAQYQSQATGFAFAIALLWVVHPLQTQSVTYIIQRAESLMGLFYLLVIYCVIRGNDSAGTIGWYFFAILSFALGMGTKEVMVTAPFTLLLHDRIFLASSWKQVFRKRWALYLGLSIILGISMASLILDYIKWHEPTAGFAFEEITPIQYALTQPGVILHYLRLAFWPHPLVFDYYWPIAKSLEEILIPGLLITLLFGLALFALRYRPPLGFLGVCFFLILAPTSSIMPIADVAFEHRMYLSLASPVALAVFGIHFFLKGLIRSNALRNKLGVGLVMLITILLSVLTIQRNKMYRSEVGIWLDTIAKRPHNPRPYNSIGLILAHSGRLEEARSYFLKALQLNPRDPGYHSNLANVYRELGKWDEAITSYQEAIRLKPDAFGPYNNMRNVLRDKGNFKEAEVYYRKAMELKPETPQLHNNLGIVLMEQGYLEKALFHYQEALRLKPDFAEVYNNLGLTSMKQGKVQEARRYFEQTLRIRPDFQDARHNRDVLLKGLGEAG